MTEHKTKKAAPKKETKPKAEKKSDAPKENIFTQGPYYALIRLRGQVRINKSVQDTLSMLSIKQRNHCSLQKMNPVTEGMIRKVKDYITWGEIDQTTMDELIEKRAETNEKGEMKKYFRLSPPKGGFERKGTKKGYSQGGALGYRGSKINDLLKKMI